MKEKTKTILLLVFIIFFDLALVASIVGMVAAGVSPFMIVFVTVMCATILLPFNYFLVNELKGKKK